MNDAFLAYPQANVEFAGRLHKILEAAGHKIFFAPRSLSPGSRWPRKIKDELLNSQTVIVLVSRAYETSPYLQEEVHTAIEQRRRDERRRVVPVYLPWQGSLDDISAPLKPLHRLTVDDESEILQLALELDDLLRRARRDEAVWDEVFDERTIAIVTGCHYRPETYDRPAAYNLKKTINDHPCPLEETILRVVVLGDLWFFDGRSGLRDHPNVISLGSVGVNPLSGLISEGGQVVERRQEWRIVRSANRWALFGDQAQGTRDAVDCFINNHLRGYLSAVWPDTSQRGGGLRARRLLVAGGIE